MNKTKLYLHILEKIRKLETRKERGWRRLKRNGLFEVLGASDCILMNAYQAASGQPVTDLDTEGGNIELGLDSAYYSDPHKLFMNPNLGGPDGDQASWIKDKFQDQDPSRVVVFSHHTPVNLGGDVLKDPDKPEGLWNEVVAALGNKIPGTWYFGHTHNAAVYTDTSAIGKAGCNGRLAGHGAIPYGESVTLQKSLDSGLIDYFPKTHLGPDDIRVRNGFATIEIDTNGSMTEWFYEIADGETDAQQVWP